jgi:hypothetical protein
VKRRLRHARRQLDQIVQALNPEQAAWLRAEIARQRGETGPCCTCEALTSHLYPLLLLGAEDTHILVIRLCEDHLTQADADRFRARLIEDPFLTSEDLHPWP